MVERNRSISPLEDPTIVGHFKDGGPITAGALAQLFSKRSPTQQEKYAYAWLARSESNPNLVLSWITDGKIRDKVKLWCLGRGLEIEEFTSDNLDIDPILAEDEELINKLGPYLRRVDLARLIALRRYREADPDSQYALVCGTYRLLGDYLGPRRYYRRDIDTPRLLSLPDISEEIFADDITRKILLESEREALLPVFNRSVDEGLKYLQELKSQSSSREYQAFVEQLEKHFLAANDLSHDGFKSEIPGFQKDTPETEKVEYSPFPSFHQKEFAYRFINKKIGKVDLLIGATRTMKSGAAQYAMKVAGAESPVIVCPSGINKLNWAREIQEKLKDDAEVLVIDSLSQLRSLAKDGPRTKPDYTIIGYQLLSRLSIEESQSLFKKLKEQMGWDGLIADEVHLAKEAEAGCTQQLYIISKTLSEDAPRIAMTATGVVNLVEDLDSPVRVLLPYLYQNIGDFTRSARNDPQLVSALLHGQELLTRWEKEAILGHKLPPIEYFEEPVPLTYFHQSIYEYVYLDDTIESQTKRSMLRQVSLEPFLIRRHYFPERIEEMIDELQLKIEERQDDRDREILKERIQALRDRKSSIESLSTMEEATRDLLEAHRKFLDWKAKHDSAEKFDEDFLVKIGYSNLALWAFFYLPQGVEEIVQGSRDEALISDWQGKQEIFSSKYLALKKKVDEDLRTGKKVIIYSGFYKTQVTSGIEDVSEDDDLAFLSLYDHLRAWYGEDNVLKIDGSVNIESRRGEIPARELVRRSWRLNPENKILLATLRSSRLGIDLSIPPTKANSNVTGLTENFIDFPDTYADIDQGIGRGWGPGQEVPVEVRFFKATNPEKPNTFRYGFIDHGMWEAIEFKRLLSQMVLDGIPLTEDEEKKVRAHLSSYRIELYPQTPRNHLFNDFLNKVRGQGAASNLSFSHDRGFEEMTNADFFSTYYPENDQLSAAGHNARAVSEIIKKISGDSNQSKVASVGSGAGILEQTLARPVVNIDMLPQILEVAKSRNSVVGDYTVGDAAQLPLKREEFDITEASFMLHWSSNKAIRNSEEQVESERGAILEELNRITKANGSVIITLPVSYLDKERFLKWQDSLERYFGFRQHSDIPSGLLRATDNRTEQVVWIFVLQKVDKPQKGYSLDDLNFEFEEIYKVLDKTRPRPGDRGTINQPIPHLEFEIVEPSERESHKIHVEIPSDDKRLEEFLQSPTPTPYSDRLSVLTSYGIEEYGFYKRLVSEAKSKLDLTSEQAQQIAMSTLVEWSKSSNQSHDAHRALSELKRIMVELQKQGRT